MKDKEQSKAEEFLKKKLYKDNYESVGVYSMSSICVLFGTMVEAMKEYAEKQRTDDRELLIAFKNHFNGKYKENDNLFILTKDIDEFLNGQIPAKQKTDKIILTDENSEIFNKLS